MAALNRTFVLAIGTVLMLGTAESSWLSNVTGINIDVAKAVGGAPHGLIASQQPTAIVNTAPIVPVPVATAEQRGALQKKIDLTVATFKAENDSYQSYATVSVFLTIIVGLCAAVAGFLRKAITAGVLSLVVVASSGAAKAFPIRDRASYYQTLYGESLSLQVETSLAPTMTVKEYNDYVSRLTTILLYGSKLPGIGDAAPVSDELIKTVARR